MLQIRTTTLRTAGAIAAAIGAAGCAGHQSQVDRDIAAAVAAGNAAPNASPLAAPIADAGATARPAAAPARPTGPTSTMTLAAGADTRVPANLPRFPTDSSAPHGMRAPDGSVAPQLAARPLVRRALMVAFTDSLKNPESATYDAAADAYFVSNVNGPSAARDGNGFISRLATDGKVTTMKLVAGGVRGAALDAPKGIAIVGDTLWVADIDAVRGFDKRSGASVATVDLAPMGAKFLNDVAVGPDGALYVTDTGIRYDARGLTSHPGPDRVFRVAGRTPSVALESARLMMPNGIVWDSANARFVIVPFGGDTIMTWKPGAAQPEPLVAGPGQFDGVAIGPDGRVYVSSAATSAVHVIDGGEMPKVIEGLRGGPADFSWDVRRGRLAVPLIGTGRVQYYELRP